MQGQERRNNISALTSRGLGSARRSVQLGAVGEGNERGEQEQIVGTGSAILRKLELVTPMIESHGMALTRGMNLLD